MPVLVEAIGCKQTVNDLLRDVLINAFAIVTGLCLRDFIISTSLYLAPEAKKESIVFNLFITLLMLFITVLLVVVWV